MNRIILLLIGLISLNRASYGQNLHKKIGFVVDSIPVADNPEEWNTTLYEPEERNIIFKEDVAEKIVVKDKKTLKKFGYVEFDGVTYVFTKAYRNRPDSIKQIPSTKQMEKQNEFFFLHGKPYTGRFIDYYLSGRKKEEGGLVNGKFDGRRKWYFQSGKLLREADYKDGVENGTDFVYYDNDSLMFRKEYINGKIKGFRYHYFPNGQLRNKSNVNYSRGEGNGDGVDTSYYSSGKLHSVYSVKNYKSVIDTQFARISETMTKGMHCMWEKDYKNAIQIYTKAIEIDGTYVDAYSWRGLCKSYQLQIDEAIADFDKALQLEPFDETALASRAFARINKYQIANDKKISTYSEAILASKNKVPIPADEQEKICTDLQKAVLLRYRSIPIMDALAMYCQTNNSIHQ